MGRHSAEVTQLSEKQVDFDISPFRRNRSIARSASICALQKNRGYGIWEVKVRPTCIDALREPRAENREPRTHHENMKTQQLKSGWSNDDVVFTDEANCGAITGPLYSEAICCFNFRQAGDPVQQRAQRSGKNFVKTAVSEQSHCFRSKSFPGFEYKRAPPRWCL